MRTLWRPRAPLQLAEPLRGSQPPGRVRAVCGLLGTSLHSAGGDCGSGAFVRKAGLGDLRQGRFLTPGASCKPEGQPPPGLHLSLVPAPGPRLTTCALMASSEVGVSFLLSFLPEHLSPS